MTKTYDMICNGDVSGRVFKNHKCRILGDLSPQGNSPIECEDYIDGHECLSSHNPGKVGHCWWVRPDMLTSAKESVVEDGSLTDLEEKVRSAIEGVLKEETREKTCNTCKHSRKNSGSACTIPKVGLCVDYDKYEPLDKKETPLERETYTMKYKLTKELTGKAIADSACRGEFELFVKDYGYHTPVDYTEEVEKDFEGRDGWIIFLKDKGYLEERSLSSEYDIHFFISDNGGNLYKLHRIFGNVIGESKYQWCSCNDGTYGANSVNGSLKEALAYAKRDGKLKSFKSKDAAKAYAWLGGELARREN